ncbi:MFS transporter [Goodfellowiella coeruleoviolacea]|uniref:Arabinose efflux permease, MFS family n=1 Tax=Goodfellowiella coeruleoviolacea TaxID=334858 RepID=A0AAE3KG68_9PSEU|nr:MFS transporter [Goodfellowiella coeruleoviolacea]MCP2165154.1 putative arabinose efflux permease, MFS family [Goodfellowiella coeruleoviolacea]
MNRNHPSTPTAIPATTSPSGGRGLVPVAALCSAVTVANIYLAQPVVGLIAADLGVPTDSAGWVATLALFGYALGVLLIVPLGDVANRRVLVGRLTVATSVLLLAAALAPALPVLALLAGLAALTTVVPQVLVPLVGQAAGPHGRAVAMAWVQAGLISGMMLSRTVGGLVGDWFGWRAVYLLAAALTLAVGQLAARTLPHEQPRDRLRYRDLLRSLPALLREEPELRWAGLRQAASFAAFNALWTTLALLLTGAPYHLSAGAAGLFGLLGLAGAVIAPLAGRLADRWGGGRVGLLGLAALGVGVLLALVATHGIGLLVAAVLVLPVGTQAGQVGNQAAALAVRPAAAGRVNTAFVLAIFLAGALGSALGTAAFGRWGWTGSCLVAAGFVVLGLAACALRGLARWPRAVHRRDVGNVVGA